MIDKQDLIKHLEDQGKTELAARAQNQLPDAVHLEDNADQLRELGLDPEQLAKKFGQEAA